jgi:hypothetical protein
MSHEESRRGRRRGRRNPVSGWREMLSGVFGVATGYVLASGADRFMMTHALNASGQDAPTQGQIYNSESLMLPLWSSWGRLGVAVLSVGVPMFVASRVRSPGVKSFFQLAGFGALARTGGKALDDGIAYFTGKMTTPSPMLVRLYAPELAANGQMAALSLNASPPAAPAATFAGLPFSKRLGDVVRATSVPGSGESAVDYVCPPGYTGPDNNGNCTSVSAPVLPPAVTATYTPIPPETSPGGGNPLPPLPPSPPASPPSPPTVTPPTSTFSPPPLPVQSPPTAPSGGGYNPLMNTCDDSEPC